MNALATFLSRVGSGGFISSSFLFCCAWAPLPEVVLRLIPDLDPSARLRIVFFAFVHFTAFHSLVVGLRVGFGCSFREHFMDESPVSSSTATDVAHLRSILHFVNRLQLLVQRQGHQANEQGGRTLAVLHRLELLLSVLILLCTLQLLAWIFRLQV